MNSNVPMVMAKPLLARHRLSERRGPATPRVVRPGRFRLIKRAYPQGCARCCIACLTFRQHVADISPTACPYHESCRTGFPFRDTLTDEWNGR